MNKEALLNDFATRSFRDIADQDYISARLSYRHRLYPQFHWQALQSLEKYFKAILLYNRIKAKNVKHDLNRAVKYCEKLPFQIRWSEDTNWFIGHLSRQGRFRYLEVSYSIHGPMLTFLDKAVWEIRRYCQVLNYDVEISGGGRENMLEYELKNIEIANNLPPQKFRITDGFLEKIVRDRHHPARGALIWKNVFFGKSNRKRIRMICSTSAVNSPLYLHPEILDDLLNYVYLPKDVEKGYRAYREKSASKN